MPRPAQTFTTSWTVNIPAVVGGNTALVGFTGGTGGLTAIQEVLNWTYNVTSGSTPPAAPTNVTATAGNTQVTLGWSASTGATSYNVIAVNYEWWAVYDDCESDDDRVHEQWVDEWNHVSSTW